MSQNSNGTGITAAPSGNGNVPGLGESFSVNLNTGQGSYTYKINLPEGVAGHSPRLTLEYAHGYGLGVFGMGWKMPLRKIWRSIDSGIPDELMREKYYESGNEIVKTPGGNFMAISEGLFGRYTKQEQGWKLEERNGMVHYFGLDTGTQVAHPDHPEQIFEWLLQKTIDTCGNEINYQYLKDQNTIYLSSIQYAIYEIKFIYEQRPDARSNGRYGVLQSMNLRCKEIQLIIDSATDATVVRSWQLNYTMDDVADVSLLHTIQITSFDENGDHSLDVVRRPVIFSYSSFNPADHKATFISAEDNLQPPPVTDPDTTIIAVDNAPLPGVLQLLNGSMYYWPNRGDLRWGAPRKINEGLQISSFDQQGIAFIDMDGSGAADLVSVTGDMFNGYFVNTGKKGFLDFRPYPRSNKAMPDIFTGNTRFTDANGDGIIDALMTNTRSMVTWQHKGSDGWSEPRFTSKGSLPASLSFDSPFIQLADMTGDGLQDIVSVQSGRIEYFSNLGNGKFNEGVVMMNSPRLQSLSSAPGNLFLLDVNDDGCDDLVFVSSTSVMLVINQNGKIFSEPVIIDNIPAPIPSSVRIADMKGNGKRGLLWNSIRAGKTCYVFLEFDSVNGAILLNEIDNGSGLVSKLFYKSATEDFMQDYRNGDIWSTNFSFPLMVVASTKETDSVTGSVVESHYNYHEAHFETNTRQFQGFSRTDKILKGDESCPDILTVFSFLMAQEKNMNATRDSLYLNSKMYKTETFALDGSALQDKPFKTEEATYDLKVLHNLGDDRNRVFAYVVTNTTNYIERSEDIRIEKKIFEYDEWGNIIRETHTGTGVKDGVDQPVLRTVTEVTYAHSNTTYIHDKPCHFVLRNKVGTILKEKKRYYDGNEYQGLGLGEITKGLLSREEELVLNETDFNAHYQDMDAVELGYVLSENADGNAAMFIETERNKYNSNGVKTGMKDKQGNETLYEYDDSGLFKTKLLDPVLGTTTYTYNRHIAQPVHIQYSDGNVTIIKYDAQGRTISIVLPGDDENKPPRVYSYDDSIIPHKRITTYRADKNNDETSISVTYFDGYAKECQHRVEMEPGKFVVSGIELKNPLGKTKQEFDPVFSPDAAYSLDINNTLASRTMYYDALERTVQTVNYNNAVSKAEYKCFEVITYDANDCDNSAENIARGQYDTPKKEAFDVFRNRTKITEVANDGDTEETIFSINENAELLGITDRLGVAVTYKKDLLGNILQIDHRESGTRKLWYNASSKVIRSLDANGNDLHVSLDEKNRIQTLMSNGNILEEYFYDDTTVNALGKVNKVEYAGGKQEFAYDISGKLISRSYTFNDLQDPVDISYGYDYIGREISASYPNGKTITKQLFLNGWTKSVDGIISSVERNARGLAEKIEYANGIVTDLSYADGPEVLLSRSSKNSNNVVLEDISFTYDKAGLLMQTDVANESKSYLYAYDPLYQVKQFSVSTETADNTYGYQYKDHFNITKSGESSLSFLYEDASHGDRITGIQHAADPVFQLLYDGNGNLLNLPGKQFTYNEKNELTGFQNSAGLTATYAYDHSGKRTYKKVNDGNGGITETFFAGDHVEIRNGQTVIFVTMEKKRIAVIEDNTTSFVHTDQSGNTSFFTDNNGTKIAAIAYRPFGNVDASDGAIDYRTFGYHTYDAESGLYYMQRRYYATEMGRFITADPIATYKPEKVIANPKALHVYAYTGNDPINNTDADGLSFWSVLGAVVGVIVGVVVAAALVMSGVGIIALIGIALLISVGVSALGYGLASAFNNTPFGEFMRGFMIGFNAGMNAVIGTAIFGPVIGVALGVINFLAAFDDVARNPVYQGILGWSSWLMPMSWGAQAVGAIIFVINILAAAFTLNKVSATKIDSISIDWTTGSIVMVGGLIRNGTAFAPGNFVFIDPAWLPSDPNVALHETGHVLSTGAFGTGFILIDFIDENIVGNGANAWGEQMADSHDPALAPASPEQMWGT